MREWEWEFELKLNEIIQTFKLLFNHLVVLARAITPWESKGNDHSYIQERFGEQVHKLSEKNILLPAMFKKCNTHGLKLIEPYTLFSISGPSHNPFSLIKFFNLLLICQILLTF